MLTMKWAYEPASASDGKRILIDRLWPRGISKERAQIDTWMKDIAPSTELRKWYGHDPEKWEEFRRKYFEELLARPEVVEELRDVIRVHDTVTFLFAAHDTDHNNALALKEFLEQQQ